MEENHTENVRNWRAKNPEKVKAHTAVCEALKSGGIIKPSKCSACGEEKPLQAHHEDYSKPLDVIWLCSSCHHALHKQKRIDSGYEYKEHKYVKKGYNNKGKSKPYKKDERYDKAVKLREEGCSYQRIADETGISKSQIYKWLNNPDYN